MRSMSQCFNIVYLVIGFTAGQLLNGQTACALGYPFTPNVPRRLLLGTKRTCRLHCAISSQRQSGKHMLALSFSGFDPLPTSLVRPSSRSLARAYFECDRQVQPIG